MEPVEGLDEAEQDPVAGREGVEGLELERSPRTASATGRIASSSGSTSTPPGASAKRTSRPPTMR